jgi:hypothetical protein
LGKNEVGCEQGKDKKYFTHVSNLFSKNKKGIPDGMPFVRNSFYLFDQRIDLFHQTAF